MSEKGDGGVDTVSLPPTYAPSEAYTESPPPAYRGGRIGQGKVVQIVKLLCVTAVLIALLTGFFVLSSNYMRTRACTCEPRPLDSVEGRAALLQAGFLAPPPPPVAQALVEEEKEQEGKENSLDAGDDTVLGDEQVDALVEEVVEAEQQLEDEMKQVVEEEEEALQDILKAQADHMKKIKLPVDLIMGNPNIGGREVNCEVERRQIPIAPGVISQTILVTCKDDADANEENGQDNNNNKGFTLPNGALNFNRQSSSPSSSLPRPPMSILAPLMKMLTSRPGPQPRLVPVSLRGPVPFIPGPRNLQELPLRSSPFSLNNQKARENSHNNNNMPPILPMGSIRPISMHGPNDRMLPRHLQPIVRITPRFLSQGREGGSQMNLVGLQRGALPLPQARPRAPPRPVSLSPFPPRPVMPFLPFKVLGEAPPAPRHPQPATHMEMKQQQQQEEEEEQHFGPPRGHTLVQDGRQQHTRIPPRLITLPQAIRVHTLPRGRLSPPGMTPVHPQQSFPNPGSENRFETRFGASPPRFEASSTRFEPPPPRFEAPHPRFEASPPRFAPEARRSPIPPQINSDAEIVAPPSNSGPQPPTPERKHHLLMVN